MLAILAEAFLYQCQTWLDHVQLLLFYPGNDSIVAEANVQSLQDSSCQDIVLESQ